MEFDGEKHSKSELLMRYPVKHYGVGGVLDQAFQITVDHFGLLFKIMAVTMLPYQIVMGYIGETFQIKQRAGGPPGLEFLAVMLVGLFVGIPLMFVATASLTRVLSRLYLSRPTSLKDGYQFGFSRFLAFLGTSLLFGIAIGGGFMLCFLPSIVVWIVFYLSPVVSVLETKAGPEAMARGWELVKGNIGTLIVLGLVQIAVGLQIGFLAGLIPQLHLKVIVAACLQTVATILQQAGTVVFYYSCRCQVEDFDLWLLADAIEAGEDPPADEIAVAAV